MAPLDWIVIAVYFAAMLAIGAWYARTNESADDYVLGGRNVNPFVAGLSLFATLASTVSYLAYPGEMIAHGPRILGFFLALPIIGLIVGWLIIPRLMAQPVTSAYELLETRLGRDVRLAGATMFVALRMLWMATIFFATSHVVLAPLLKLDSSWIPALCLFLGVVTILYSSFGGLKAILVTDAVQALLMIGGAVAMIVVVAARLGSPLAWIPNAWPEHWEHPAWDFKPDSSSSIPSVILSTVVWYCCTNGSDQMSIQRFLSTRDLKTARRTLFVSLTSDFVVTSLLLAAGAALLVYHQRFPEAFGAELDPKTQGDRFLPIFVAKGMPCGLAGMVIAAILAAAMSSLSSGMNSVAAVIDRDLLSRFDAKPLSPEETVLRLRCLTLAAGMIAVGLAIAQMLLVQGNLLERCMKVINLLTVPLFVLFFLALYVPFATRAGAWWGLAAAIVAAVTVAYGRELFLGGDADARWLSVFWMMPSSLAAGTAVGTIVSALTYRVSTPTEKGAGAP
jgi:solute:Na+ symporter, SSS family